ncbi:MAG: PEP-CTERM sorting domain-containing protein [Planctomycetaceae bacterium]|jgi:hypothetical protein|nr:PEP-CTERM sorting domain-containing protein [Planctomycetaceae bacterium]
MKKVILFLAVVFFLTPSAAFSDISLMELYGVKLKDQSADGDMYNLYGMLNNYLGLNDDEKYANSIDLFNERGIDPTTQWMTSGSTLIQAFNQSSYLHQVNVLSSEGVEICKLYDQYNGGSTGEEYALEDGLILDFLLLPYTVREDGTYNYAYAWSSDPSKNANVGETYYNGDLLGIGDGGIHMIAFDITDLYNDKKGTSFNSVYMFGLEDLPYNQSDFDYNDMAIIMTNLTPTVATPEPATMLILLAGGGLVSARYLRRKRKLL